MRCDENKTINRREWLDFHENFFTELSLDKEILQVKYLLSMM